MKFHSLHILSPIDSMLPLMETLNVSQETRAGAATHDEARMTSVGARDPEHEGRGRTAEGRWERGGHLSGGSTTPAQAQCAVMDNGATGVICCL